MIGELIAVISWLLIPISSYVIARKLKNDAIDDVLGYFESEEGEKYIYRLGAIAASGFGQGIGLSKGKGKFSWEGLLAEIAGKYAQQWLGKAVGGQQTEGTQQKRKEGKSVPKMG